MIRRVHLVYPHGDRVATPDAIGRELGSRLAADGLDVVFHDWAAFERIPATPDAALVGHAHPLPGTTFRRSLGSGTWGRRLALQPFAVDVPQVGFLVHVLGRCDLFLAITGTHWIDALAGSPFEAWAGRIRQLDLAVDPDHFPPLVTDPHPPGGRRLLYVGRDVPMKNLGYLDQVAAALGTPVTWAGPAGGRYPHLDHVGPIDFQSESGRRLVADHDLFVTVGKADANPTTVIEAMAWGLLPVCTPESGYDGYAGIQNVPLDDPQAAAAVLAGLSELDDEAFRARQGANWARVRTHFNWDRFADQVRQALVDPVPDGRAPRLGRGRELAVGAQWWSTAWQGTNRVGIRQALTGELRRRRG